MLIRMKEGRTACGPSLPETLYERRFYDLPEKLARDLIAGGAAEVAPAPTVEVEIAEMGDYDVDSDGVRPSRARPKGRAARR